MGRFKREARRPCPPANVAPNKFQERPFGASRMQENHLAAMAYSASIDTQFVGDGCPLPKNLNPLSAFGPLHLLTQIRRCAPPNMMSWIRLWLSLLCTLPLPAETKYRPGVSEAICPLLMAVRWQFISPPVRPSWIQKSRPGLRPSMDGSAVRTSLVAGAG